MKNTIARASLPVTNPRAHFRFQTKPAGFWGFYPSLGWYGVGQRAGLGASRTSGPDASFNNDSIQILSLDEFNGKDRKFYFLFSLQSVAAVQGWTKVPFGVNVTANGKAVVRDDFMLKFQGGNSVFGLEGLPMADGEMRVELSGGKARLFAVTVPIEAGWPTTKVGVIPFLPPRIRTVVRDQNGWISRIVEEVG